jgi:cell division protein FtsW
MADVRWASPYKFFYKQLLWIIFGFVAMFLTAFSINYKFYQRYAKWIYLATLASVIAVLFIGSSRLGARRWLEIFSFTVQPSELAKIAIVIYVSDFMSRKARVFRKCGNVVALGIAITFMIFPIVIEPDLGTPVLLVSVCFAMLFYAGIKLQTVFVGVVIAAIFITREIVKKPYRLARLKDYIASFVNIDASSYQVKQSLNALGSGGFFGKGLGKSEIKLMYLPEAHTDFIFPIIGEELGFLGAVAVVIFFLYLFFRGVKMSKNMPDVFSHYLCLGITFLIVFQAALNLSVATGIFPAKGLPLPFISFGGTSLLMTMIAAGILINLSQYKKF